ncbi:CPBP family intramembrane metalloprotease [bacterium M00.F.Ca.ET.159.01.1.1]|nr:CPBP family intramembrane metalloprotease [bacterium M00.F.Ca.ET.159.01.1.1]
MSVIAAWRSLGFRIVPHTVAALGIATAAGATFACYMAAADFLVFRDVIPASMTSQLAHASALQRIAIFTPLAVIEDIVFRLLLLSIVAWALVSIAGKHDWCYWAAILASALIFYPIAHYSYLSGLQPSFATVIREIMLHGGAGVLWGLLYWRYGLLAAMCGHVAAHIVLEPLMGLLV